MGLLIYIGVVFFGVAAGVSFLAAWLFDGLRDMWRNF